MTTVTVYNKEELKLALNSSAAEIVVKDEKLVKRLRLMKRLKKGGPLAIGAVIAAIPLIPFTGGASLPVALFGTLGFAAAPVAGGVVWLVVAIGGVLLVSILTDWEEVEVNGVFKLKRKPKRER